MKIVILSGGSGNDSLVKGLVSMFKKDLDVKVIVNAYDSGKSTGICRKVTDTLGVSDIRKNHVRQYKALNEDYNRSFAEFLEARYDIPKGNELEFVKHKLEMWGLEMLCPYADRFFARETSKGYDYNDFCIGNIIYAEMFAEHGYAKTNTKLSKLIGFPDNVLLNSFDNVYIQANTKSGHIIDDEGIIVEWKNEEDPIVSLSYIKENRNISLNNEAIESVKQADYIIISTGTFWSSIYPTLEYGDFYKYINESNAKKVWAMNTICDKDSYGCGVNEFTSIVEKLGLNLKDFTLLLNDDAVDILKEDPIVEVKKVMHAKMGNNKGKHDPKMFVKNIVKVYFDMCYSIHDFDNIYIDFDDTLWARDSKLEKISKNNILKLNDLCKTSKTKFTIVSGNSYESIQKKLYTVFGSELKDFEVPVWADCATTLYSKNKAMKTIGVEHEIHYPEMVVEKIESLLEDHLDKVELKVIKNGFGKTVNVKIRGLEPTIRKLLHRVLVSEFYDMYDVKMTGKTTIDVSAKFLNKTFALAADNIGKKTKTLYIGDEFDSGNDLEISKACTECLHTNGVIDTSIFLELLSE